MRELLKSNIDNVSTSSLLELRARRRLPSQQWLRIKNKTYYYNVVAELDRRIVGLPMTHDLISQA